jgi:hypothetical protein
MEPKKGGMPMLTGFIVAVMSLALLGIVLRSLSTPSVVVIHHSDKE